MSEPAEELFLQFLRSKADIKIFVSHATKPEFLSLERLPPRRSGERRFFLWNTAYPWTPEIAVASNGSFYIQDIDSAPVIEYCRDPFTAGCYDSHTGRLFWSKFLTPGAPCSLSLYRWPSVGRSWEEQLLDKDGNYSEKQS